MMSENPQEKIEALEETIRSLKGRIQSIERDVAVLREEIHNIDLKVYNHHHNTRNW